MGRDRIVEKLNNFISTRKPITDESQVAYLMVEIRKILDHEKCKDYPILRFYCNWTVHIDKRIDDEMMEIIDKMYKDIELQIKNPALVSIGASPIKFAYMENLRLELRNFLVNRFIDSSIIENDNWVEFVKLFVKILEDQPIENPTPDVTLFSFIPAAERCVQFIVVFKSPIEGKQFYKLKNAY